MENSNMDSDDRPRILNVDDDAMMREIIKDDLEKSFQVISAKNGNDCLNILKNDKIDLIILDVEMPGLDGYETCHRIKDLIELASIPVIFLSSHDNIEDRLKGYECGGEDYILKPFNSTELINKINNLLRLHRERNMHHEMAQYATNTAMTAMTSMGEMGALISTMKAYNTSNTLPELTEATLNGLSAYDLKGVIQIRTTEGSYTYNESGEASPLEVSVINHMTTMDRITSFKNRMCITYERISLLVNDMPLSDPDRCGRLRDHLAMMVEAANERLQAILLGNALNQVVMNLSDTLAEIDMAQRQSKAATLLNLNALNDSIIRAYISLGMTDAQEDFLSQVINNGIARIINEESENINFQDKLSSIINELKKLRRNGSSQ